MLHSSNQPPVQAPYFDKWVMFSTPAAASCWVKYWATDKGPCSMLKEINLLEYL